MKYNIFIQRFQVFVKNILWSCFVHFKTFFDILILTFFTSLVQSANDLACSYLCAGIGLNLIISQTIGLMGYIGPLTLTLVVVRLSISPIVRCIVKCNCCD